MNKFNKEEIMRLKGEEREEVLEKLEEMIEEEKEKLEKELTGKEVKIKEICKFVKNEFYELYAKDFIDLVELGDDIKIFYQLEKDIITINTQHTTVALGYTTQNPILDIKDEENFTIKIDWVEILYDISYLCETEDITHIPAKDIILKMTGNEKVEKIEELKEKIEEQIRYIKGKWTDGKVETANSMEYIEDEFMYDLYEFLWLVEGEVEPKITGKTGIKNKISTITYSTEHGSIEFGYTLPDYLGSRDEIVYMNPKWFDFNYNLDYLKE
ncbi:hypothetical protein [Tepidimicrobium xylanilyticum]